MFDRKKGRIHRGLTVGYFSAMNTKEEIQGKAIRTTYFSLIGNLCLAIVKLLAGIFGFSFALIADAIESGVDVASSIIVLMGLSYANRPPDKKHPYGHGRLEPLITFSVVGFLIVSAAVISYQAIQQLFTPQPLPKAWTLLVLAPIIVGKECAYRWVNARAQATNSSSLKADAWHHRADALTSLLAFIGISIALLFGEGFEKADSIAALLAAQIILYNCYLLFRPALGELMDEQVHDDLEKKIRGIAPSVDGVMIIEKCYIRKSGLDYHVDLHAIVHGDLSVREGHEISHNLQDTLKEKLPQLGHVLIHIEPHDSIESAKLLGIDPY